MNSLAEAQSLVRSEALWVGLKSTDQLVYTKILGSRVVFLGRALIAIAGADWNTSLATATVFAKQFTGQVRIGALDEVYKKGWICTPLQGYIDYETNPIILKK